MPIGVIGKQYNKSKYGKDSLQYLRQRYYRLKRISDSDVKSAVHHLRFDDWHATVVGFIEHFGLQNTQNAIEFKDFIDLMSEADKREFIDKGLDFPLRNVYLDLASDVRSGDEESETLSLINGNLASILNI